MTTIGIIRKVDHLGRLVIPKEYRDFYHFALQGEVEIVATTEGILLRRPGYIVQRRQCELADCGAEGAH